jgi:hypothetical protein
MKTMPHISKTLDLVGRSVSNHPKFWVGLGNIESALLKPDIENIGINAPVYICGLARSGSTILLETLASLPGVATHRLRDFPFIFTPYWNQKAIGLNPLRDKTMRERAHGDGIMVSPDSPEAMEEMLWMAFFPHLHTPGENNLIKEINPAFDRFYRQHVQKLLLARKAKRFVAKNNYTITRLPYLQQLFPDARFVIPVRDPVTHIASLMRQHRRFYDAGRNDPRVANHMSMSGHFEFGLNRTPIHTGDDHAMHQIKRAWNNGEEVRGWALYWDMVYRFIHQQLEAQPVLASHALFIRFETLCGNPETMLRGLAAHTQLPLDEAAIASWSSKLRLPSYYEIALSAQETSLIRDITRNTAALYNY